MGIELTQTCDRCGTSRGLSTVKTKTSGGWRSIPVRSEYGEARDEQPWLCVECLKAVEEFIYHAQTDEEI